MPVVGTDGCLGGCCRWFVVGKNVEQNILALSLLVFAIHVEPSCCLALSVGTLVNLPSVGSKEVYLCAIQTVFSFSPSRNSSHCSHLTHCSHLACHIASAYLFLSL